MTKRRVPSTEPALSVEAQPSSALHRATSAPSQGGCVSVSEDDLEALTERAAIMEYDGGLPRADAERAAVVDVHPRVTMACDGSPGTISKPSDATVPELDPRLLPFVEALVELMVADLVKFPVPPKERP